MTPPSHMFSVPALCRSPRRFFENPTGRFAHLAAPNLLPRNQTAIDSLRNRLADEVALDRAGFDRIKDRPRMRGDLKALDGLYVARGQIGRNRHVQLRRIQVRQAVKTEHGMVATDPLNFLVPVPGPQCPKDEIWPIRRRKQSEPVNATVLANPVSDQLGDLKEPPRRLNP